VPLYEWIQKFADPPLAACPICGGGGVQRLLSPPAIHFKGSGWYVTDYARKAAGGDGASKETAKEAPSKEGTKKGAAAKDPAAPAAAKDNAAGTAATK
jgi:putative FmdB family regulatory protein